MEIIDIKPSGTSGLMKKGTERTWEDRRHPILFLCRNQDGDAFRELPAARIETVTQR